MKRALILCFLFLLAGSSGYCSGVAFAPLQPVKTPNPMNDYTSNVTTNPDPFANPTNVDYPDVTKIERTLFGKSFVHQDISTRLSRIERSMFSTTYPSSPSNQRIDNIISNFNQINKNPNISSSSLTKMESKILNQTYEQSSPQSRIERLEQQLFGTVRSGDLNARMKALEMATANINKNYANAMPTTQRGWKGLANALGNSFSGGSMTGFTPQVDPFYSSDLDDDFATTSNTNQYNQYNYRTPYNTMAPYGANPYMPNRTLNSLMLGGSGYPTGSGIYRGYRTMHGYGDSFRNYGTGSSVTILD